MGVGNYISYRTNRKRDGAPAYITRTCMKHGTGSSSIRSGLASRRAPTTWARLWPTTRPTPVSARRAGYSTSTTQSQKPHGRHCRVKSAEVPWCTGLGFVQSARCPLLDGDGDGDGWMWIPAAGPPFLPASRPRHRWSEDGSQCKCYARHGRRASTFPASWAFSCIAPLFSHQKIKNFSRFLVVSNLMTYAWITKYNLK